MQNGLFLVTEKFRTLLLYMSKAMLLGSECVRRTLFTTPEMVQCCFEVSTRLYSLVRVKILMCLHLHEDIKQNKHKLSLNSSELKVFVLVCRFVKVHPTY